SSFSASSSCFISSRTERKRLANRFCRLRQNNRRAACAPGLFPSAFVGLDYAALHTLNLRVMRQHMHSSVAPAKKCTEQPAHEWNYDRAEKCAPEARNFKTW